MEKVLEYIQAHQNAAPWIIFSGILLAGLNIPISLDALIIISAILAATTIPEKTLPLFFSVFFGALVSAWISYWFGRLLGNRLLKVNFFSKWIHADRLEKIKNFYRRHGLWTLMAGRFIPFGVRNCIFFSTGLSRFSFFRFALRDFFACLLWCLPSFYLFYSLGMNYHLLASWVKRLNIFIFLAFSVTVISLICYKLRKKKGVSS